MADILSRVAWMVNWLENPDASKDTASMLELNLQEAIRDAVDEQAFIHRNDIPKAVAQANADALARFQAKFDESGIQDRINKEVEKGVMLERQNWDGFQAKQDQKMTDLKDQIDTRITTEQQSVELFRNQAQAIQDNLNNRAAALQAQKDQLQDYKDKMDDKLAQIQAERDRLQAYKDSMDQRMADAISAIDAKWQTNADQAAQITDHRKDLAVRANQQACADIAQARVGWLPDGIDPATQQGKAISKGVDQASQNIANDIKNMSV